MYNDPVLSFVQLVVLCTAVLLSVCVSISRSEILYDEGQTWHIIQTSQGDSFIDLTDSEFKVHSMIRMRSSYPHLSYQHEINNKP